MVMEVSALYIWAPQMNLLKIYTAPYKFDHLWLILYHNIRRNLCLELCTHTVERSWQIPVNWGVQIGLIPFLNGWCNVATRLFRDSVQ